MSDYNEFYKTIDKFHMNDKINSTNSVLVEIYDEKEKYEFFLQQISKYVSELQKDRKKLKASELGTKSFSLSLKKF